MAVDDRDVRQAPEVEPRSTGLGLIKGLGVTLKHALRPSITQQYPQQKPDLPPRTRGVIALKEANCTVCYKCSRECPDWCIYIDAHKETHEPASGGKGRSMKVLDRFAIDYALCMYCGICVEVCPFDALFWSPEFEYAEYDIVELTHEKEKLEEWTYTVLPPPFIEDGAEVPPEEPSVAPETAGLAAAPSAGPAPAAASPVPAQVTVGAPAVTVAAPAEAAASGEGAAPAKAAAAPPAEHADVAMDQETFDRVLAELLEQGTDRRVAEGRARRAAMVAARTKAEGGS
ncbi:MAG TPA: NADH-quinone oxidoreductase subunit I [Actinomycetota bacterium]|nr:NADH-quinone oxidoreductase subunit I [Actinomycetota bacterium]